MSSAKQCGRTFLVVTVAQTHLCLPRLSFLCFHCSHELCCPGLHQRVFFFFLHIHNANCFVRRLKYRSGCRGQLPSLPLNTGKKSMFGTVLKTVQTASGQIDFQCDCDACGKNVKLVFLGQVTEGSSSGSSCGDTQNELKPKWSNCATWNFFSQPFGTSNALDERPQRSHAANLHAASQNSAHLCLLLCL